MDMVALVSGGFVTPYHCYATNLWAMSPDISSSPIVNGVYDLIYNVTGSAAVSPTAALAGVNVNAQTGSYQLSCPADRLGEIEFNLNAAHQLSLPQAGSTTCLQSSMAFVVRNASTSTAALTIVPTTSTFQPEATSSKTVIPGGAMLVYSDGITGAGNYHVIDISQPAGGTNVQTASYALTVLDRDHMVVMNCSSACVATLPAILPSATWSTTILSIGSTLATVSLNGLLFNGGFTPPTLGPVGIKVFTNGTNYFGDTGATGAGTVTHTVGNLSINQMLAGNAGGDIKAADSAGVGYAVGVLTTDVNPLAITATYNNVATNFGGVNWVFTNTTSGAGSKLFQLNSGAAGTTNVFAINPAGNMLIGGKITNYASGLQTVGMGVAPILGVSNITARTTSQGSTNIVTTVPTSGSYRIVYYADQNALCATGSNTVLFTFSWTDASNARTLVSATLTLGSTQVVGAHVQDVFPIFATAASAITYTSTIAGTCTTGGPSSYDVHVSAEELQ